MADIADRAQDIIDADLERSLDAARHRYGMGAESGADNGTCIDCAEPIAPARLAALPLADRCFDCQSGFENGAR